eukprot:1156826-Pelagomonas_calceolata.AAC.1
MFKDNFKPCPHLSRSLLFFKVKSRAGIVGIECSDMIAKYQASLKNNNLTDTSIPALAQAATLSTIWLAQEEARPTTPGLSSPIPNLMYLSDLKNSLKSHMHAKHRLGYADCKTGYYTYYQSLLPHANTGISNVSWNMPCVST